MLAGSYIDIQNQIVLVTVALTGSPFSLHYSSDRVPGRYGAYSLEIPLSMENIPAGLEEIRLEVYVAGQVFTKSFSPLPEQSYTFTWDSKDTSGIQITGIQQAKVRVGYVYKAFFPRPAITRWTEATAAVGTCGSALGLSGWSMDINHFCDPVGRVLYLGVGGRQSDIRVDPSGKISNDGDDSESEFIIAAADANELYLFNSIGRHLRTIHALTAGVLYHFQYDAAGRLIKIKDGDGNITQIEHRPENLTEIVGPYGQRTTLNHNNDNYLAKITNGSGESVQFSYSKDGLLESLIDANGNSYGFTYDRSGRLVQRKDATGAVTRLASKRDRDSSLVVLISPLGRESTYLVEHLATGEERRVNKCCGGAEIVELRHENARILHDPDGTVIKMAYLSGADAQAHLPLSADITVTTPGALVWKIGLNRSAKLPSHGPLATAHSFSESINVNGRIYSTFYDDNLQTFTHATPAGRHSMMAIDRSGNIVKLEVTGFLPINFAYDLEGRLVNITQGDDPDARTVMFQYTREGYVATIVDSIGRQFGFSYDADGHVVRHTLPDGRVVQITYNACGNLASFTPPGRSAHTFGYTPLNLLSLYNPPNLKSGNQQTLYEYDADGQLNRIRRPDGKDIQLSYDSGGRPDKLNLSRGQVLYTHDPENGKLLSILSPDGIKLSYSYDGSLLIRASWSGIVNGAVERVYDNNFRIMSLSVNDATIPFQYDDDGLVTKVGELILARNPQTGLIIETALREARDARSYNGYGELDHYSALFRGTLFYDVQYIRDKLGRISAKQERLDETTTTVSYGYDVSGRLTEVKKNGTTVANYAYDSNSNRISGPTNATIYTYDDQDRLLTLSGAGGTLNFQYNQNGELESKTTDAGTTLYNYDELGNLIEVILPGGARIEYLIDGLNRRVGKRVNGILVRRFLYLDTLKPVAELDADNRILSYFVFGSRENVPNCVVNKGRAYRIVADHLGSPRLVFDVATGAVMQRMDYDEFGNVEQDTNSGFQPFGFAGGLYDSDTKLVRFGFRDYDAEIGRWTARDPILFAGSDLNLYEYVLNDPVNMIDPDGLWIRDAAQQIAEDAFRKTLTPEQRRTYDDIKEALKWIHPVKHAAWEGAKGALHVLKDLAKQNPDLKKRIECFEKLITDIENDPQNWINQIEVALARRLMDAWLWPGKRYQEFRKWNEDRVRDITNQLLKHIPYRP